MSIELPDAPWIRDAELNGVPDSDDWYCPVCHAEAPDYIYIADGEVLGCCECIKVVEGWQYVSQS